MGNIERYQCPTHGETLNEQQALGPYCRECHGRVDPLIVEYAPASQLREAVEERDRLRRLVLRDHGQGHRPHADCPACQRFGVRPNSPSGGQ